LEENINIVLSQSRVSETNPEHNLLINNKERKQYVKQENDNLHQEILHHIIMTQESGNKMPLYSSKKITYSLLNIFTIDGDISIPSFPSSLTDQPFCIKIT
jgi:hypothetical protein